MNKLKTLEWRTTKNDIFIQWKDQHESTYPYLYLRCLCPCATCREDKIAKDSSPGDAAASLALTVGKENLELKQVEPIGNYALQFRWSDGHNTGIYSLDFLRGMCPCPLCHKQQ
ncbi:MAG: DUF971 domain-containing protein [Deltaproteobacteria bacterium]|nr:DUF971 domain-containing protein [Deltaproteobacteria bacterium]